MPSVHFSIRWPDDTVSDCYSPSRVINEYLEAGRSYPLSDFVERSRTALRIASERVRQKYGYACSAAADQLEQIERTASRFDTIENAQVVVEAFRR